MITIIGILVALLLPAVQAVREAARRSSCVQNLVQLAVAVQNYELHHGVIPPGTMDTQGPILSQPVGYHHNWLIQILPYLEQPNVYQRVDPRVGVYHPTNVPVRRLDFSVFRCPSAGLDAKGYSTYAGVHHDFETPIDVDNQGVFFLNSRIRFEDLGDGSSNTIFCGEKLVIPGDLGWMSGTRATLRNAGSRINAARGLGRTRVPPPKFPPAGLGENSPVDPPLSDEDVLNTLIGSMVEVNRWSGRRTRTVPRPPNDARLAVGGFGSLHPGGAQFAFGDGHVVFLSETMDERVYVNHAHRNDGELPPVND